MKHVTKKSSDIENQAPTPAKTTLAKRVYLVEKNSDDITLTRRAILQAGYAVHLEALQTADALIQEFSQPNQSLAQPVPDLILIDTNLPDASAYKLVQWIRSNTIMQHAPVVMISSSGKQDDIFNSYKYGASSVIQKPVAFTEYAHVLKDACSYWLNISVMPHNRHIKKANKLLTSSQ